MNQTSYHIEDQINEKEKLEREMKQYEDSIEKFKQNKSVEQRALKCVKIKIMIK